MISIRSCLPCVSNRTVHPATPMKIAFGANVKQFLHHAFRSKLLTCCPIVCTYTCAFASSDATATAESISEMVEEVVEEAGEKSWQATAEKATKVQSFLMEGVELNLATDEVPGDFCDASSPLSLAGYMNGELHSLDLSSQHSEGKQV